MQTGRKKSHYAALLEDTSSFLSERGLTRIETAEPSVDATRVDIHERNWFSNFTPWSMAKPVIDQWHPGLARGVETMMALTPATTEFESGFQWRNMPELPEKPLVVDITITPAGRGDYIRFIAKPTEITVFDPLNNVDQSFRGKNRVDRAVSAFFNALVPT